MYLIIDNSSVDEPVFAYYQRTAWKRFVATSDSRDLLSSLNNFLTSEHQQLSHLEGLGVVLKKGSFTATRVAVTIVNTLALSLHIPVLGVVDTDAKSLADFLTAITQKLQGHYVAAEYSALPHVG